MAAIGLYGNRLSGEYGHCSVGRGRGHGRRDGHGHGNGYCLSGSGSGSGTDDTLDAGLLTRFRLNGGSGSASPDQGGQRKRPEKQ
jgi:hypothetical protein